MKLSNYLTSWPPSSNAKIDETLIVPALRSTHASLRHNIQGATIDLQVVTDGQNLPLGQSTRLPSDAHSTAAFHGNSARVFFSETLARVPSPELRPHKIHGPLGVQQDQHHLKRRANQTDVDGKVPMFSGPHVVLLQNVDQHVQIHNASMEDP
mmetsp:Transcript_11248/g.31187  ORF Transcript_11248/g.31187 Transcript_11248/m.31187 type:complete len:153 (-) Transcript_11248:672-1130(-)